MIVKIGDWEFDSAFYDREADVLYLSIGEPRAGVGDETPEGHVLRFDEAGRFCGVTLISVRQLLETKGTVEVTLPHREQLHSQDLEPALA